MECKLTDAQIKNTKPAARDKKLYDGGNLYVLIRPGGSKLWRYDYRLNGRRNTISFGIYPDVTLKEARERHKAARSSVRAGIAPTGVRPQANTEPRFRDVSDEWVTSRRSSLSAGHIRTIESRLRRDIC